MRSFLTLLLAILLCACQSAGPAPAPRIITRDVAIPTPVPCVPAGTPQHQPARTATPATLLHAPIDEMLTAITAELVRRRAYDDAVEPVIAGCRTPRSPPGDGVPVP